MRTLDFLPGPLELPFEKGIINDVVVDDGEDEAKVIGGNVVPKSRRVETVGENDEDEGGEAVVGENDEDEMSEDGGGKVGEAVVGENDEDEMSEDGGGKVGEAVVGENDGDEGNEVDVEEIQRINNTETDIQEAVTNVMLEYSEGIYC